MQTLHIRIFCFNGKRTEYQQETRKPLNSQLIQITFYSGDKSHRLSTVVRDIPAISQVHRVVSAFVSDHKHKLSIENDNIYCSFEDLEILQTTSIMISSS